MDRFPKADSFYTKIFWTPSARFYVHNDSFLQHPILDIQRYLSVFICGAVFVSGFVSVFIPVFVSISISVFVSVSVFVFVSACVSVFVLVFVSGVFPQQLNFGATIS